MRFNKRLKLIKIKGKNNAKQMDDLSIPGGAMI